MESATYWQQLFTQALRITQRWRAEQTRSERVLAAAVEFQSRLRLLSRTAPSASTPCVLAELPDAVALLRGKHLRGLENIMASLRDSVAVFAGLHADLVGLHVRHCPQLQNSARPSTTRRAVTVCQRPLIPLARRPVRGGSMAARQPTRRRRLQWSAPAAARWNSRYSFRRRGSASTGCVYHSHIVHTPCTHHACTAHKPRTRHVHTRHVHTRHVHTHHAHTMHAPSISCR